MVNKLLATGVVAIVCISGYIYFTPDTSKMITTTDEYDYVLCPTTNTFTTIWNTWSYEYLTDNPAVDVDTQMDAWNAKIITNGCDEEWLDPLDDLIEQESASATPVYWYNESN